MNDMFNILGLVTPVTAADTSWFQGVLEWFRITNGWQMALVVFGLVAQAIFFARWTVQWLASEKRGESHMPDLFWWLSLTGASMMLVYFVFRRDPVAILGQSVGWAVYTRNIYLIRRKRRLQRDESAGSSDASGDASNDDVGTSPQSEGQAEDQSNDGANQASTALDSGTGSS